MAEMALSENLSDGVLLTWTKVQLHMQMANLIQFIRHGSLTGSGCNGCYLGTKTAI